jgi:magnesium-transporting ATPase (P-type)
VRTHRSRGKEGLKLFELLEVIEFTSDRKRMSCIVRCPNGEIKVLSKGADSKLVPLLKEKKSALVDQTNEDLMRFGRVGYRTLLLCQKTMSN